MYVRVAVRRVRHQTLNHCAGELAHETSINPVLTPEPLQILFNLIVDEATQKNACTCLDSYLEILGDDIANYLTLLMDRLLFLLEGGAIPVKITVTGAIGSAAHAGKEKFQPYFQETIKRLVPLVSLREDDQFDLRGVATDTIGTIADAVGAEMFRPFYHDLMKLAFEALTMDNTRLRESSFIFFGVMAQVFEGDFAGYLTQCVPALVASCQQNENSDELLEDGESIHDLPADRADCIQVKPPLQPSPRHSPPAHRLKSPLTTRRSNKRRPTLTILRPCSPKSTAGSRLRRRSQPIQLVNCSQRRNRHSCRTWRRR